ncbi:hypothetical protein LPJ56_005937 [Coemansia sp. RSA 2599]|nr:hypothetical protein LPJ75_005938 [Coemansia sp. RSA 2598]KAJ1809855.1 hypothetical protein LPJ56_005937 [Coemansia sp. RSA 2599]
MSYNYGAIGSIENDAYTQPQQFRPYRPPPAPLSPEDIAQRKWSLGIMTLSSDGSSDSDEESLLSMGFSSIMEDASDAGSVQEQKTKDGGADDSRRGIHGCWLVSLIWNSQYRCCT